MNATQKKTIVMLWNLFRNTEVKNRDEVQFNFETPMANICIIKIGIMMPDSSIEDHFLVDITGRDFQIVHADVGSEARFVIDGNDLSLTFDGAELFRMPWIDISKLESMSVTIWNDNEIVQSIHAS